MSRIQVHPIELPKHTGRFVKSWWPIYADDPHWVPPLVMERKTFFDPKQNPYFKFADVAYFIAERDGQAVGTIAATVDHELQKTEPGIGLFGFFEFVDDEDDGLDPLLPQKAAPVARGERVSGCRLRPHPGSLST